VKSISHPFKGVGRNDPCPCGSGRKFKKCCLAQVQSASHGTDPLRESPPETDRAVDKMSEAIRKYDPLVAPEPEAWLAMGEQDRLDLVSAYHQRARLRAPNAKVHSIFHVIVENRLPKGTNCRCDVRQSG